MSFNEIIILTGADILSFPKFLTRAIYLHYHIYSNFWHVRSSTRAQQRQLSIENFLEEQESQQQNNQETCAVRTTNKSSVQRTSEKAAV
jgi:hypothetical protein